jgi:PIN domain nuclease of toxin-antitoxin system
MKYLLDTHTFIWWDASPEKLSAEVLAICQNPQHVLYVSLTSLWEMQIKQQLGKLSLNKNLDVLIADQVEQNNIQLLPIKPNHIFALANLPMIHKDPFDRLLISQAKQENLTLLSKDSVFKDYSVEAFW